MPAASTHSSGSHSPLRILVAEDDPEMRRLVIEALRKDGYDVREASDGAELLFALSVQHAHAEDQVDLIVSDIRMPFSNGLEIVESLRRVREHVPIILMTAFGDDDARARAKRVGATLFDKPFEISALRAAVRSALTPT